MKSTIRQARVSYGFVWYLMKEFRWPLLVFLGLVLGVGLLFFYEYRDADHPLGYAEACHGAFMLIFMNPTLDFPREPHLQPLFFLVPILGLGAVADSLIRLANLLTTKKSRLPEWHRIIASTYRDHVIVMGAGRVGARLTRGLLDLGEDVVVIESETASPLVGEMMDLGIPVILGDGRRPAILEDAGIRKAKAFVAVTTDDLANLDAALTTRDLRPEMNAVIRLFDDNLANLFARSYRLPAISTSRVSAPAFVAAVTGRTLYQVVELPGISLRLAELTVRDENTNTNPNPNPNPNPNENENGNGNDTGNANRRAAPRSPLIGLTVGEIQERYQVNVIAVRGPSGSVINPEHDQSVRGGEILIIIAPVYKLAAIEQANREESHEEPLSPNEPLPANLRDHVIVVGAGRVGFQIIKELVALREKVIVVERPDADVLTQETRELGVPVILGKIRSPLFLESLRTAYAKGIVLCTDDDLTNIDASLYARSTCPGVRVVTRLFDDTLARRLAALSQIPVISRAEVSAPAFMAKATGRQVYQQLVLDGKRLYLTGCVIAKGGALDGLTVGQVQDAYRLNLLALHGKSGDTVNPPHDIPMAAADEFIAVANAADLVRLDRDNREGGFFGRPTRRLPRKNPIVIDLRALDPRIRLKRWTPRIPQALLRAGGGKTSPITDPVIPGANANVHSLEASGPAVASVSPEELVKMGEDNLMFEREDLSADFRDDAR